MGGAYDEIDLEDMDWNSELGAFTYQCPVSYTHLTLPTNREV